MSFYSENAPANFLCPITQEIMTNPVITKNGITFDRHALKLAIRRSGPKCPMTRAPLTMKDVVPNLALKSLIEEWKIKETARKENARQEKIRQERARFEKARQEKIRQENARQEKARQEKEKAKSQNTESQVFVKVLEGKNLNIDFKPDGKQRRPGINVVYEGKPVDITYRGDDYFRELNVKNERGNYVVSCRYRGGFD